MRRTLGHLAECCSGDNRPNCPILDDISELAKPCESHAHDGHKTTPAGAPTH
jgi:MerR family copper efflux transcriptional regulator